MKVRNSWSLRCKVPEMIAQAFTRHTFAPLYCSNMHLAALLWRNWRSSRFYWNCHMLFHLLGNRRLSRRYFRSCLKYIFDFSITSRCLGRLKKDLGLPWRTALWHFSTCFSASCLVLLAFLCSLSQWVNSMFLAFPLCTEVDCDSIGIIYSYHGPNRRGLSCQAADQGQGVKKNRIYNIKLHVHA